MENYAPLLLVLLALLFVFRASSRARRQQQAVLARQAGVTAGDRVIMTCGLHGTVVDVAGDVVVLETGPGGRSSWARAAIGEILTSDPGPADGTAGVAGGATAAPVIRPEGPATVRDGEEPASGG